MKTYEKMETVFVRDMEGSKKLLDGQYRSPTVEYLKDLPWVWTEKVDGMNIRVTWDGHSVSFAGRTDKAVIPKPLLTVLEYHFGGEDNAQIFEQCFGDKEVILFGEGYGHKIQAAGDGYLPNRVNFIMFDMLIDDNYQSRVDVERTAEMFGVDVVPVIAVASLPEAVEFVKRHPKSTVGKLPMEGLVCRPLYEMRERTGKRVIVKIKWRDMKELLPTSIDVGERAQKNTKEREDHV